MARPLRIEYPGAVYHVTARGNAREAIFLDDEDRKSFLAILGSVVERFNWLCHAYCLMTNHYHLLIETPDANLSQGMRQLNGVYTQAFNRRHDRVGHVLQGRFKSVLIEKESYLLEAARYVVLNPVRAKVARNPRYWKWCSYAATAVQRLAPEFLTTDWLLKQFNPKKDMTQRAYSQFVAEGKGVSLWDNLQGGILLGSDGFIKRIAPILRSKKQLRDVPKAQRFAARPTLAKLFRSARRDKAKRNARIREAYLEHGYTLSQIGDYLQLHYSTVSRIARGGKDLKSKSKL